MEIEDPEIESVITLEDLENYEPSPEQARQLEYLKKILGACEQAGLNVTTFAGYGLDGLYGKLTRDHHDIDLFVQSGQEEKFDQILTNLGFILVSRDDEKSIFTNPELGEHFKVEYASTGLLKKYSDVPTETFFPNILNASLGGLVFQAIPLAGERIIDNINQEREKERNMSGYPAEKQIKKDLLVSELEKRASNGRD